MANTAKAVVFGVVAVLAVVVGWDVVRPTDRPAGEASPVSAPSVTPAATARSGSVSPSAIDLSAQVTKNMLYTVGKVPAVRCRPPGTALTTKAALLGHGRVVVDCMHRAWAPLVARGDFFFEMPKLGAYEPGENSTTCGPAPEDSVAFYCLADGTIHFEWELFVEDPDDPEWSLVDFQYMLAHEYGHHLQSAVGIMAAYDVNHESASEAAVLQDERRLELQAGCFGAAFLGANRQSLRWTDERREIFEYQVRDSGDEDSPGSPPDHGSRKSHAYWTLRAFESGDRASCNTFTASAKRVS
ncbi:hypothetical protein E1218_11200 [Kribbella turkmenica]|uniref:Neutral zinc metallopeptidase n=1 Tax=Kribbella turkmenica TaxID=2530375 RepID=A0A4R4X9G2_9ACTN|nr:neutral zinc metallopeptidase [Kribbella turkmenica]TDD27158.1 hypothetical protein E1218_11200 [Kribbella turkmenica]